MDHNIVKDQLRYMHIFNSVRLYCVCMVKNGAEECLHQEKWSRQRRYAGLTVARCLAAWPPGVADLAPSPLAVKPSVLAAGWPLLTRSSLPFNCWLTAAALNERIRRTAEVMN